MDEIREIEELLLGSINMANLALNMPDEAKIDILQKYEILASAKLTANNTIINDNLFNYSVLMNKTLFLTLVQSRKPIELMQYTNLENMLNVIIKNNDGKRNIKAFNKLYTDLANEVVACGGELNKIVSPQDIQSAVQTFGIEHVDDIDDIPLDDIDTEDIDLEDGEYDDIFDNEDIELEETDIELEETDKTEEDNTDERKEQIVKLYGAQINQTTDTLVKILTAIYKSGFDAMPQDGLLFYSGDDSSPFIKMDKSNKVRQVTDEGSIYDYKIMKALASMYPQLASYHYTVDNEVVPELEQLMKGAAVCHKIHLNLQNANIDYCTGRLSIRKWITETQLKDSGCANSDEWIQKVNKGRRRLTSFKSMVQPWYRWCIKNIIADSLVKAGVKSLADADLATEVIEAINGNLRNVIVVQERNIGEKTDIKISTSTPLNVEDIKENLSNTLNIKGNNSIEVKEIAHDNFAEYGVLTLSIEFDKEKANKSDLFAYEIVDKLIESGNTPSWDHALLGKKEDGTYFFWDDFMGDASPAKRIYTIYAGSRSGKGIMTSTLISSALCDGKHVFYTDGKPENGACLGMIAWNEGKEAYVFDGQESGKKPFEGYMENYTKDMRTPVEVASYIDKCPNELFENDKYFSEKSQRQFLGVMRYLKSLAFCASTIEARASGTLPSDDWQIWIFDEMTDMSNNEKEIREIFSKYIRDKAGAKEAKTDTDEVYQLDFSKFKNIEQVLDPGNERYDAGVVYIKQWSDWCKRIRRSVQQASVINIGKANLNLIFIFQEATWIANDKKVTTIGRIVNSLKSTKIVGRGALANACGDYGDATNQKTAWYSKVNSGTGWWAISNSADLRTASTQLFKPYNVWTVPLDSSGLMDINGDRSSKKYLAGYVQALLGSFGLSAADIINESYLYAEEAIKTLGYASSIKEFMYDCTNFALTDADASYANLKRELGGNGGSTVQREIMNSIDIDEFDEDEFDATGNDGTEAVNEHNSNSGNTNEYTMSDDDAFGDMGSSAQERPVTRSADIPAFTSASVLKSKGLSDEILVGYFNKHRLAQRLQTNTFNYANRSPQPAAKGLALAAIYISNYVYITNTLGIGQTQVVSYAFNQINAGHNGDNSYSFLLGMIDALNSGQLQFDKMPSTEQMREWANKYIQNNPVVNNQQSEFGENNPSSNTEDLGSRVLRLSQQICIERGWSAQQLIEFQQTVLKKMGVQ